MQIQQSRQHSLGVVNQVPAQVLTSLVVGQQIEASVVKAALVAQIASLRVGETLIEVKTPIPLQQGQTVKLELVQSGDKPVLKLILPAQHVEPTPRTTTQTAGLLPGQQVAVEVIKVLSDHRVLVGTPAQTTSPRPIASIPLQFDIDIAQLTKTFAVGEKVVVEIATVKPLTVVLKAETAARENLVVDRIKQLVSQLDSKPSLALFNNALKTVSLPSAIQDEASRLVEHVLDKKKVTQPQALRQAIQSSGVFTEKTLLQQPHSVRTDFKANLLKLASLVESTLDDKLTPLTRASRQRSGEGQTALSSLQTFASMSLGKSQVPIKNIEISHQNQSFKTSPASVENQTRQLRSPFALQTSSTVRAAMTAGQALPDEGARNQARSLSLPTTTGSSDTMRSRLTLLSTLLQAVAAHNATPSSISVLHASPTSSGLPNVLPPFLNAILTPSQASALAQALHQSMATDLVRVGGPLDVVLLQGVLKEVESLQARIQLNQFSMLKEPDSPSAPIASWLIDLPLKDKQTVEFVQLQIDQFHKQQDAEAEDVWSVQLRLDTQNLGPMQATVTLHNDDIKIVMRAEREESASLLAQHLPQLYEALGRLDVSVSHISCGCGGVVKPTLAEQYLAETSNLVDVSV